MSKPIFLNVLKNIRGKIKNTTNKIRLLHLPLLIVIKNTAVHDLLNNKSISTLLFVTAWTSASASTLKLATLGAHKWLGVRVRHSRSRPKVLHGLSGVPAALQQHHSVACGHSQRQLVKSYHFTTCTETSQMTRVCCNVIKDYKQWNFALRIPQYFRHFTIKPI